jgi:hypothetical protein
MQRFLFNIFEIVCLSCVAACGPKSIDYIKLDHPKAQDYLIEDVELYYEGEKTAENAEVLDHIIINEKSTDCETAAIMALVKMQKKAQFRGGNAVINIKAVSNDDTPADNGKGFWCTRLKSLEEGADFTHKIWEITFEGDIAALGAEAEETPLEEEALPETPDNSDEFIKKKSKGKTKAKTKKKKGKDKKEPAQPGTDMVIEPSEIESSDMGLESADDIY